MPVALPKRSEVEEKYTWNLAGIFADDAAWEADRERVESALPELEKFKGQLGDSAQKLLEWFRAQEETVKRVQQLVVYSNMLSDSDTANQEASALKDRGRGVAARSSAAISFAEPELLSIPEEKIEQFMEEKPELALYRHYFHQLRKRAEHVRSPEVEEVLASAADVIDTSRTTHALLADADLRYGTVDTDDGPIDVAAGTLASILRDPDIRVRKEGWEKYADGFIAHKNTFASCISGGVKRDVFYARARNYPSALEAALAQTHIPRAVYDNMIQTSVRKLPVWHRYWSARRKALGLDMLHPYDIFAPIAKEDQKVDFEQSVDMICEGMAPLGDDYCAPMKKGMLEERWVDVFPNQGKRSGAYSSGAYGTNPFILMSHVGDLESMSTLAHEIGHSMHSYLSRKHQPMVYARYGIFAAEVASNFNQAMVRSHLLKNNSDPQFQIAVIEEAMYNFHRYFFLMPILARFELDIHTRVEKGEALTADLMIKLLADLFREGYGPEMEIDEARVGITWAQFSTHMYLNFYVYQYATGIAAANALAAGVFGGESDAADKYKQFLSAGGSNYPLEVLKIAGVDMTSPEPVERAFDVLEGYVERLEKLTA
ncbi:MAG: oligoendopeptidase F [Chloroflexia bacterium]